MSRDLTRDERVDPATRVLSRDARPEGRASSERALPDGLRLPRTETRHPVEGRDRRYALRDSESRTLATVGTFRVVPASDLAEGRSARDVWRGDLRHLEEQGLVERQTVVINHEATPLAVLTPEGKAVLDRHQDPGPGGRAQQYHAGLAKPREIAHDAQLYRLFQAEAERIEREGGRVTRVVLDAELKRDYQRFLNRPDRADDTTLEADQRAFAHARELPLVDGHLALPDLRLEYEAEDGRLLYRDVELVTEHYSRGQLAGKAQAGFAQYRAAGAGRWHGSGASRTGGTPFDPHHLERLG